MTTNQALCELSGILSGCLQTTVLVICIGAVAAGLDWLVRWLHRRGFSKSLCELLHWVTLLIAVVDCSLVLVYAGAHAWDARPPAICQKVGLH